MPTPITFELNGQSAQAQVEAHTLLVDLLRVQLRLTGTHVGCDTAQCGCCTVLLDGQAIKSCSMLAVQADGRSLGTVEGLAGADGQLHPVQEAFIACHGLQCGFCTPGMMMAATALLTENPRPTDEQIVHALEGNLCRCTGYTNIVAAVRQASKAMSSGAAE
jgi:carbon-monoxide dehydrogenase small subunit